MVLWPVTPIHWMMLDDSCLWRKDFFCSYIFPVRAIYSVRFDQNRGFSLILHGSPLFKSLKFGVRSKSGNKRTSSNCSSASKSLSELSPHPILSSSSEFEYDCVVFSLSPNGWCTGFMNWLACCREEHQKIMGLLINSLLFRGYRILTHMWMGKWRIGLAQRRSRFE